MFASFIELWSLYRTDDPDVGKLGMNQLIPNFQTLDMSPLLYPVRNFYITNGTFDYEFAFYELLYDLDVGLAVVR